MSFRLILTLALIAIAYCNVAPNLETKHHTKLNLPKNVEKEIKIPGISPYLEGGTEVSPPHKYPFLVALTIDRVFYCGGILINVEWVLTAAHCTYNAVYATVQMGAHNISANEASQILVNSTNFITHEAFDRLTFVNDIALIKLPEPLPNFTDEISSVALPRPADFDLLPGENVTMIGWGEFSGGFTDLPYEATVAVISNEQCAGGYGDSITEGSLCTAGAPGLGSCSSDGGGPVIYETGFGTQVRGIISFAGSCGNSYPSVHTRLTHYTDWIQANTGIVPQG